MAHLPHTARDWLAGARLYFIGIPDGYELRFLHAHERTARPCRKLPKTNTAEALLHDELGRCCRHEIEPKFSPTGVSGFVAGLNLAAAFCFFASAAIFSVITFWTADATINLSEDVGTVLLWLMVPDLYDVPNTMTVLRGLLSPCLVQSVALTAIRMLHVAEPRELLFLANIVSRVRTRQIYV